ncbi:transcription repressor OFP12-like [Mercurialis annua]|uniref:transcription repressor OFP12-like n=1 Tax=Mercurialis annua TaxID=3986 RepID=UPI00215E7A02|nr:transcription repressor OFP12-like [Mercurialis annua]
MSIIFWKNLLKCLPTAPICSNPLNSEQEQAHLLPPNSIPTKSIMIKNMNSLYDISSTSTSKSLSTPSTYSFTSSDSESDTNSPPDFAAVFASQRFFFSSPGRSNSIIESPETPEPAQPPTPLNGGVAVKKYSPDPYTDFKHSMQEMIEARKLKDVRAEWRYLHELLSCYLNLNPKHTHQFIISAFADIVICLLSSSESDDTLPKPEGGRRQHNVNFTLDKLV